MSGDIRTDGHPSYMEKSGNLYKLKLQKQTNSDKNIKITM